MVCKHKNEWSYTMDEIKPEVKELYDFGIQLEEVTAEKQKLETERDDSLAKMETKIENLMWWDEASKKTYTAPIKEEDKTKTSSTKRPSMLPEGTVVEEIPQKDVVPLYNKTTAAKPDAKPDAKPTEDSIPTTSTTAAPAPETKVEEKEVPPKRMFPSTNIVHHFHPIAWVEQMKLVFGDETGECYCNRDFTVEEFKNIFIRLRRSEEYNLNILNGNNCNIPSSDKILERLTEEFNITAKKYEINKCIQKIHFLAQIYWESDRLKTGLEYASGNYYNPIDGHKNAKSNGNTQAGDGPKYKGRGFMQLTWRSTQIKYLKHAAKNTDGALKGKSDAELELRSNNYEKYISDDLAYALDSAGWFWSNYKKAGSKYSEIKGKNLNEIALFQDKYQKYISILVNGGGNGKKEREKYYKKLKRFLKLDTKCINNKNSSVTNKNDSNTPWVKTAKGELGVEEIYGIKYNDPRVLEYHETAGYTAKLMGRKITDDWIGDYKDAWCGSFVYWCYFKSGITKENLNKSGYNAYSWRNWGVESDKKEPCYGALAVCNFSHVGFVVGKKGNKIVLLGGNQTGGDTSTKGMVCYTTVKKEDIITYRYPSNFNIQNINYDLKEISTNSGSDNFGTSR